MKKLLAYVAMMLCVLGMIGCGTVATNTEAVDTATVEENVQDEQATAQAEEEEAKKKAEEEKKAKEEEAKKAEEELKAREAEAARLEAEAKAAEEELRNGLADDVDVTKIVKFDEPKTMYAQRAANIRKGPSKSYDKAGHVELNTEIKVLGRYEEDGWYYIEYNDARAFIGNSLVDDKEVDLEALKAAQEAAALAAVEKQKAAEAAAAAQAANQPAAQQVAPPPAQAVMAPAGVLIIGDSRCEQMYAAVGGGGCSWVYQPGKGYDWLVETGLGKAEPSIGKGTKVLICLGVNDTRNANNYAALINQKAAEWAARGAKTYFVSVNPVWDNPWVTEDQVVNFNGTVASQLSGVRYIDTHSLLINTGYYAVDGLHYDTDTYVKIFNAMIGSL